MFIRQRRARVRARARRHDVPRLDRTRSSPRLADGSRPRRAPHHAVPARTAERLSRGAHHRRARRVALAARRGARRLDAARRPASDEPRWSWHVGDHRSSSTASAVARSTCSRRSTTRFLTAQHSPLMSPLAWDLAHIGNYEDLWLVRALGGDGVGAAHDDLYDAFRHPRADRPSLPLLSPAQARAYVDEVRERALALLEGEAVRAVDPRLLDDGFVYGMVVQHEHQHDETMLATLQLSGAPTDAGHGPAPAPSTTWCSSRAARSRSAPSAEPWAYDNERPAHIVDLAPYWIDATPVTNGAYAEFIASGGYDDERLWHPDGWQWRRARARDRSPVLARRRQRAALRPLRRAGSRRTGAARVLVRSRRVRPLGGPALAHRSGMGARQGRRTRARCGSGPARHVRGLARVHVVPVPRVLRGVLRHRLPRAARWLVGHARSGDADPPSATGTSRSGARSSRASAVRRTPADVPPPRLPR